LIPHDNILLKSNIHVSNPFSYVVISDSTELINEQLKKYDFKKLFIKSGGDFNVKSLGVIHGEDKSNKENFLSRKTKRAKIDNVVK
jgi:hypothetical protein